MREIKFQVLCKGELFGYERLTKNGWEWMCVSLNPEGGERWLPGILVTLVTNDDFKRRQFTGLKDCKGVEIYEGDLLKDVFESGIQQEVIYDEDRFMVKGSGVRLSSYATKGSIEVIGNIWQHPALLINSANQ